MRQKPFPAPAKPFSLPHLILILFLSFTASPAVFQYSAPVATPKDQSSAFLWIPPGAKAVRGIVMGGMTLMEREMAKDNRIRQTCANHHLAIVFLKCGLGRVDPQTVLNDLAKASGYAELSVAPLFFVGHSTGGPQAKACALKLPTRCFGLVQYRGGAPGGDEAIPPGLPALMMVGQFDEFGDVMRAESGRENWENSRDNLAAFRKENPRHLVSIVVEPGAGHFAWSDRNARYLALFIGKAAQARIPASWPADAREPVPLQEIDHRTGWLTGLTIHPPAKSPPAPDPQYQGDKAHTSWHFDQELAEATLAYHADGFGMQDQFLHWNDPFWVDAGTRFFFTKLQWTGDGQTFQVHPAYANTVPSQHNGRGPRWLNAGQPVGHSSAPILLKTVSGPVAVAGSNTLRIHYDELAPATESSRVTFMAYSAGDAAYRYTEQVGMMPRGFNGFSKGKPQSITFPPPEDLRVGGPPLALKASSDSGLPVQFHVAYGPATILSNQLVITDLPVRATFPIPVKVVAYQFGSGVEPLVQTAAPVAHELRILGPR